jgi:CTP-dependent riboflavin kinase
MDRQDAMRQELKQLIEKKVVQIIAQWKLRADMNLKAGKMSPN